MIDIAPHLTRYAVFAPLQPQARNKPKANALFRTAVVGEWGWNVHWTDDMKSLPIRSGALRWSKGPRGCGPGAPGAA